LRVGVLNVDRNHASYHVFNDLSDEYGDALLLRRNDTPKTREAWLNDHKAQMDVLVVNPERVMTGLDLIAFPTLVWYQVGFKTFVLRQASARARRPGQTQHCKIAYFYYQQTKQEAALALMGEKEAASQALEGRFDAQALRTMMNGDETDVLALLSDSLDRQFDAKSVWTQTKAKPKPHEPNLVRDQAETDVYADALAVVQRALSFIDD